MFLTIAVIPLQTVDTVALTATAPFPVLALGQGVFRRVLMPLRTVGFIKISIPPRRTVLALFASLGSLSCSVRVRPVSHASPTVSASAFAGECIFRSVGVPVNAFGTPCVDSGRAITSGDIFCQGDSFKVPRVTAGGLSAKVVYRKAEWNLSDERAVNKTVNEECFFAEGKLLVPIQRPSMDLEQPARGLVPTVNNGDELPEPLRQTRVSEQCGTIEHIDSTQSVVPRGVSAPAGLLPVILQGGGGDHG
jgi:hypothetical protein